VLPIELGEGCLAGSRVSDEENALAPEHDAARVELHSPVEGEVVLEQKFVQGKRDRSSPSAAVTIESSTGPGSVDEERPVRLGIGGGLLEDIEVLSSPGKDPPKTAGVEEGGRARFGDGSRDHVDTDVIASRNEKGAEAPGKGAPSGNRESDPRNPKPGQWGPRPSSLVPGSGAG
jgi:hypothetical protein